MFAKIINIIGRGIFYCSSILLLGFSLETYASTPVLSLCDYLHQVRQNNMGGLGNALMASGAKQRIGEGRLLMKPSFFAEGQYLKDNYDPNWSPIIGNSSSLQSYKAGFKQTTPFGLEGKLYYNYQHQTVSGTGLPLNQVESTASSPIAEIDLSLARNLAGRETRANARLIDSQARLDNYSQRYKNTLLMADAESAYWRLAITRQIVAKQQESLNRAQDIQRWMQDRVKLQLADEADLLQTKASTDLKKLEVQSAINDQRIAEINFNTLRGCSQEKVVETLMPLNSGLIESLHLPTAPCLRGDVKIAEEEQKIKIANAQLGIEKNKPDLNLYASYALNGNNPSSNQAISESFTSNYPSTAVGLRLSLPLDISRLKKDRTGYRREIRGAKYEFQQKVFENYRLWESLTLKILNAKKRFDLAHQLEHIQFCKLQVERQKLSMGRTTTYQVLLFEQDYVGAQIEKLMITDEILGLMAQLKTFGV